MSHRNMSQWTVILGTCVRRVRRPAGQYAGGVCDEISKGGEGGAARPEGDDEARDTDAVRHVWQSLNLPGLIDIHTHFMPRRLLAKVQAYFDAAGPLIGRPWPIHYRQDEEERLAILRGYGVLAFSSLYPLQMSSPVTSRKATPDDGDRPPTTVRWVPPLT
jgi:hypothetical protein